MSEQQDQERPPDVTCSGGFQLPKLSAFVPDPWQLAEMLARKEHERGE